MPINNLITLRKGSESEWVNSNTILANGEPGYDTTNGIFKIGDGVHTWTNLTAINVPINRQTFNISSPQTEFGISGGYLVGSIDVYYNGVKLIDGVDYIANNGSTMTLLSAAISGSVIETINMLPTLSYKNLIQSENIHPFLFSGM
jgi:hypothetical protein